MVRLDVLSVPVLQAVQVLANPNDYAPFTTTCSASYVRPAKGLSQQEADYITARNKKTDFAMADYLSEIGFDLDMGQLIAKGGVPVVALAFSGGGLRSMVFGGGVMRAYDDRTRLGYGSSPFGGILQGARYMAGLSGGSWLVASSAAHDFATADELAQNVWNIEDAFHTPSGNWLKSIQYYVDVVKSVSAKKSAGFRVSITDLWARILAYHCLDSNDGMAGRTWSSIVGQPTYKDASMPFPILEALYRPPSQRNRIPLDAAVVEMTPVDFGSWHPSVNAFAYSKPLGTSLDNGNVMQDAPCFERFDNIGFMMGISSSLFSANLGQVVKEGKAVQQAVAAVQKLVEKDDLDVALVPNPFKHLQGTAPELANLDYMNLVDGGMAGINLPLWSLLRPERQVDIILAADASADTTDHWPDGSSLVNLYNRIVNDRQQQDMAMPLVPSTVQAFAQLNRLDKVTFFGCSGKDSTAPRKHTPLIVYVPNSYQGFYSNFSTFDGKYSKEDIQKTFDNAYAIATQSNDAGFKTCMACAIAKRSFDRSRITLPAACVGCFKQYCWSPSGTFF